MNSSTDYFAFGRILKYLGVNLLAQIVYNLLIVKCVCYYCCTHINPHFSEL